MLSFLHALPRTHECSKCSHIPKSYVRFLEIGSKKGRHMHCRRQDLPYLSVFYRSDPGAVSGFLGADSPVQLAEGAAGDKVTVTFVPMKKLQALQAAREAAKKRKRDETAVEPTGEAVRDSEAKRQRPSADGERPKESTGGRSERRHSVDEERQEREQDRRRDRSGDRRRDRSKDRRRRDRSRDEARRHRSRSRDQRARSRYQTLSFPDQPLLLCRLYFLA